MNEKVSIHWFRRDLRIEDNTALHEALKSPHKVICLFIFDKNILDKLVDKDDRRVTFIYLQIQKFKKQLQEYGADLIVKYGFPEEIWKSILNDYNVDLVYANHDYEPYGIQRDEYLNDYFHQNNIQFNTYKDAVIFEKMEVGKDDATPYTVFTPYSKKWKSKLNDFYLKEYPTEKYIQNLYKIKLQELPSLEDMGFIYNDTFLPSIEIPTNIIAHYDKTRNFPALKGTSTLGIHLRFGTISIRKLANIALANNEQFLNELIWRDFYQMILFNFPHVVHNAFKKQYDAIKWRTDEKDFEAWCEGKTGYPIVDAGMRELNNTGYMHNRVRMIVASFLTKHLLIDWRWGEAYFAQKLIDFELASNNGGWQWASGSGTDAAPYFRIFSPSEQTKKFDDKLQYIRKWIPELDSLNYPQPIVDHKYARERCLKVYKEGLEKK
jgi:deoxyribodipyrimidine photo-lyase